MEKTAFEMPEFEPVEVHIHVLCTFMSGMRVTCTLRGGKAEVEGRLVRVGEGGRGWRGGGERSAGE